MSRYSTASALIASIRLRISGRITFSRASLSIRACDVLLMSSEVHAKWKNSFTACSSGTSATFSFRKYSTAFTSWLVVRSISLIRRASSSEKFAARSSRNWFASALNAGTSAISAVAASFCSQRISTIVRYFSRPYSLKISRNAIVLLP